MKQAAVVKQVMAEKTALGRFQLILHLHGVKKHIAGVSADTVEAMKTNVPITLMA